ncbi:HipA domain-containing protein, partial [Sulfuricurvum sp.]|uniref:HipA domain-containing protein n=1 Tax=Sulfuricurvum sp. TaxID=2025608 RepID=UPI002D715795
MKLNIFCAHTKVGELFYNPSDETFSFSYEETWIEKGFVLSPHIRFDTLPSSSTLKKFFANLLPEGKGLEELSRYFQISKSNIFGLIEKLSFDTAGALFFSTNDHIDQQTNLRPVSLEELQERIIQRRTQSITVWDGRPRLSLAGIQDKLPILFHEGEFGFGEGDLCSTHILKFDTKNEHNTVLNEYLSMQLAKVAGIQTAEVELLRFNDEAVLLVKRFDRRYVSDTLVERLHIVDGCQMLDLSPSEKYERPYGSQRDVQHYRSEANFKNLFALANRCSIPALATQQMIRWSLFNLIIGNYDAHAKNISFFITKSKIDLTPFYDLLNVSLYPQFAQDYSMAFGDTFEPDNLTTYDLAEFCHVCTIKPKLLIQEFRKIAKALNSALASDTFTSFSLNEGEKTFILSYTESVSKSLT